MVDRSLHTESWWKPRGLLKAFSTKGAHGTSFLIGVDEAILLLRLLGILKQVQTRQATEIILSYSCNFGAAPIRPLNDIIPSLPKAAVTLACLVYLAPEL